MTKQYYDNFVIHQVLTAPPGWRAVYQMDDGTYDTEPVPLFALVTRRTYPRGTRRLHPAPLEDDDDEMREVIGLAWVMYEGFDVVNNLSNFKDLLPPDFALEEWVALHTKSGGAAC